MKYIIEGGHRLTGKIRISGNKNSVFPCVAAALLTQEEVILENISSLKDTEVLIKILKKLGVSVQKKGSVLTIKAATISQYTLPDLVTKLRGSIVLVGSILSRMGKVKFHHPGGDIIGRRSIEVHLEGFRALGVNVRRDNLKYFLTYESREKKEPVDIFIREASVTATENLILAAVKGSKTVVLRN